MQNIHTAPAAQTSNIQTPSIIKSKAGYTALASYLINLYELAAPNIRQLSPADKQALSSLAAQAGEHIGNVSEAAGKMAAHLDGNAVADDMFFGLSEILLLAETQRELNDTAMYLLSHTE